MIGFATASVAEYENYAMHAERHESAEKENWYHEDRTE